VIVSPFVCWLLSAFFFLDEQASSRPQPDAVLFSSSQSSEPNEGEKSSGDDEDEDQNVADSGSPEEYARALEMGLRISLVQDDRTEKKYGKMLMVRWSCLSALVLLYLWCSSCGHVVHHDVCIVLLKYDLKIFCVLIRRTVKTSTWRRQRGVCNRKARSCRPFPKW